MIIGSDETLKGDTFGGLVVAAVMCTQSQQERLKQIGVGDSKKIHDSKIHYLAKQIKELCPYSVRELFPIEYNQGSQTKWMNDMHKACADELKTKTSEPTTHVVDKYPGCAVGDVAETKAEDKYIEVAAASIVARERGLDQFDKLSREMGFVLPKGSTHVADALARLKMSDKDPAMFAKMHFKNVQKALK